MVVDHGSRQVWRFDFEGRTHELWFYTIAGAGRASPAVVEFYGLQSMQKAGVPSRRAIALLAGFILNGTKGDAVIVEPLAEATPLDRLLCRAALAGEPVAGRRSLAHQVIESVQRLGQAGLGHADLQLDQFLVSDGKVYLEGGASIHRQGLLMDEIFTLAADAERFISRMEMLRAWRRLGHGRLPARNPALKRLRRRRLSAIFRENEHFVPLASGGWSGHCYKSAPRPFRWSVASRLSFTREHWAEAWPMLLKQIEAGQFETIKEGDSGRVLGGRIILGGHPIEVVVKHPRRQYWYRYLTEIGRGSRPRRAWKRAWQLIHRDVPTGWPLIMMERRIIGYAVDAMIVFERIDGTTLDEAVGQRCCAPWYRQVLRQCGRLLRRIEDGGLYFYDAKATNWMVREDEALGEMPMIIDVDGIRGIPQGGGLPRLLRSLREHADGMYSDEDALAVVSGYAPYATGRQAEHLAGTRRPVEES
jgi:hypothetical protein